MLAIGAYDHALDFDLNRVQVAQLVGFVVAFCNRIETECEDLSGAVMGLIDNAVPRIIGIADDSVDRRAELQELIYG